MTHTRMFLVSPEDAGERLDRYLATRLPELSRTRIQELIDAGRVRVAGAACKRAHRVEPGEQIEVEVLPRPPLAAQPEAIPLEILYEDDDVVIVNKPAGMVVHAGAGKDSAHGTLVNALLHRYQDLSQEGGPLRPGIVHRLDKETSGVIVVARNDAAHRRLADAFRQRRVKKTYLALVHGNLKPDAGTIELRIARDPKRRTRMTARRAAASRGREARTRWRVLLRLGAAPAGARVPGFTLVEVGLETGRTHQIRVHFSALGHPVVGDTLYGAPRELPKLRDAARLALPPLGRNFLHAARISFEHPRHGAPVEARALLPTELQAYLARLAEALGVKFSAVDAALRGYL